MDPFFGRVATFLNLLIYVLIRWPHGNRMKTLSVDRTLKGKQETTLLTGAALGTTLLPMIWVITGFPSFADYPLHPIAFAFGTAAMVIGNRLFYRSHADLGLYWSPSLEMREDHVLMTTGIYARVRHPMYSAMFLQGIGQLLFLPNWIVGPAWLVTFGILYLFRVRREEQMMRDRFGESYEKYMQQTGRLIPRLGLTKQSDSLDSA